MNNYSITSVITMGVAFATTIVLFVWAKVDKRSHPWSWMAASWTCAVFLVFGVLWCMALDGYQTIDIMFMSNAVPGVILWSLITLFVVGINETRLQLKNGGSHDRRL